MQDAEERSATAVIACELFGTLAAKTEYCPSDDFYPLSDFGFHLGKKVVNLLRLITINTILFR